MQNIKKLLVAIAALGLSVNLFPSTTIAINCSKPNLTTKEAIQCGSCDAAGIPDAECKSANAASSLTETVAGVINLISLLVGIAAVVMIMVGGFRYVTSAGKQESVAGAKNTILYALIGLVIVALAQVIVRFVLQRTT